MSSAIRLERDGPADGAPVPSALFVGMATLDLVQRVARPPGRNEKVLSQAFLLAAGGPAANAAVTASVLGVPSVLVSAVGHSALGEAVRADLARYGVELIDRSAEPAATPPVAAITVTVDGDRSVVSPGGVLSVDPTGLVQVLAEAGPAVVLSDGHYPALALPILAAAAGRAVRVLDAGSVKPGTDALLTAVDVVVASDDFRPPGCHSAQDVLAALADAGVRWAAVTRGRDPVLYRWGERLGQVEVPRAEVVDTLGAGDVFHGALVAALARAGTAPDGLDEVDPDALLAVAASVAATSVATMGTRAWIDTVT